MVERPGFNLAIRREKA